MKYWNIFLLLSLASLLKSQDLEGFLFPLAKTEPIFLQEFIKPEINYKEVEGNPFYYEGYGAGFLVYSDSMYRFSHLSLDIIEHDIVLLFNLIKIRISSNEIDGVFIFNAEKNNFDYFQNANKFDFGRYSITGFITGQKYGVYNVYCRPGAEQKPINENLDALGLNKASKVLRRDQFFIEEEGILKPANNKKQVVKFIDKRKQKRAESIIKKNKLKFNKFSDFQRLFQEITPQNE